MTWDPKGAARRAFARLPFALLYELFYQSGRALGVTGMEVPGPAGTFIGPIEDQSVIKPYLRDGAISPMIVRLFTDFFTARGGGTFYDLGANIGFVTIPVSRVPGVRCVAFEPDPRNWSLLRLNVLANCPGTNVEIVNAAVAGERGELGFARNAYNCGDHHLAAGGELRVPAVPLDDHPPGALPLAVKIDCQGAEPAIIAGGHRTLAQADLVVMEFWPWGMRRMGLSPDTVLDFAANTFPVGQVLHHDQPPGPSQPIAQVVDRLRQIIADGGKLAQADLVLARD